MIASCRIPKTFLQCKWGKRKCGICHLRSLHVKRVGSTSHKPKLQKVTPQRKMYFKNIQNKTVVCFCSSKDVCEQTKWSPLKDWKILTAALWTGQCQIHQWQTGSFDMLRIYMMAGASQTCLLIHLQRGTDLHSVQLPKLKHSRDHLWLTFHVLGVYNRCINYQLTEGL